MVFKCKMCGGDLKVTDEKVIECEYCGSTQTVASADDEKKANLFNRANRLRMENNFDKAAGIYESIVSEYPEESEGYWGLVLCTYGIEYVDDSVTGKKIPTCHRTITTSVMDDPNFDLACEYADTTARAIYRDEAKTIDKIQRKIIEIVEGEEPYDIFICYKETDDVTKGRTEDSSIAQDIYTELISAGYKVFFSRVTLREKAGTEYEPYIYAALKSAKVMLAIGTKFDYYDAPWVKNEWGRYIAMMQEDSSKHLIPCFKNIDAYDIPKEFKNLQALDMGDVTFYKNLMENISRFIQKETVIVVETQNVASATASTTPLLERMFMFLEDGEWANANEYAEKVLDLDPKCAEAYLGKLMVDLKVKKREDLSKCKISFEENPNYEKLIRFANDALKLKIEGFLKDVIETQNAATYSEAIKLIEKATIEDYRKAANLLNSILEYRDAKALREKCDVLIEKANDAFLKKQSTYCVKSMQTYIATYYHTVGLKADGTVVAVGDNDKGQCKVSSWKDIVAISAGGDHTVGLKTDGTVVAVGSNDDGQCNVSSWKNIVAVSAGSSHTVGLKGDGTVVAVGANNFDQCNVSSWKNIVAVSAGFCYTVGLKADGTVVAVGSNDKGQCKVSSWKDIVAVSAGSSNTVGLKADGTVVAVGRNFCGECNVSSWKDIVAISTGGDHTVGLKGDGTVVAAGGSPFGESNVSSWKNIVAVSAGGYHTVGLKGDGTVVAVGRNFDGECNVSSWKDIMIPIEAESVEDLKEKRIEYARQLKEKEEERKRQEEEKRRREEEERRRQEEEKRKQMEQYRALGVCQHCGGELKGFFSKKCVKCGKPKDY